MYGKNLVGELKKYRDLELQGVIRDGGTKEALEAYNKGMNAIINKVEYHLLAIGYGGSNYV